VPGASAEELVKVISAAGTRDLRASTNIFNKLFSPSLGILLGL
jgi:hypothetical protein